MLQRQRLDEVVDRFNILEQRMAAGPAADEFVTRFILAQRSNLSGEAS